jgi:hypothetical protein
MKYLSILLAFLFAYTSFAQSENAYQVELKNIKSVDKKTYEFEVYIKAPKDINISAYQCAFIFNKNMLSGEVSFEYISGTSQMVNKPITAKVEPNGNHLAFASGPGFEQIKSEKLLGKFRIKSTTDFIKNEKINLQWDFTSVINTIITGTNSDEITKWFYFKPKN